MNVLSVSVSVIRSAVLDTLLKMSEPPSVVPIFIPMVPVTELAKCRKSYSPDTCGVNVLNELS